MANVVQNLLALETIVEVDWDASYAGVPVDPTVRYLYYDYDNGLVDWLTAGSLLPMVVSRFGVVARTTLHDS